MGDYAASIALRKAWTHTKTLLIDNFDIKYWLKLSLVVFLLGFGLGGSNYNLRGGGSDIEDLGISWSTSLIVFVLTIVFFLILLGLVFKYISSVFHFIFVYSVVHQKVLFKRWFGENMNPGLSLFIFRILVSILMFLFVAAFSVVIIVIAYKVNNILFTVFSALTLIVVILFWIILSLLILSFTTDFVVPLMISDEVGIIHSWKVLTSVIKSKPSEFVIYLILKIGVGFITAIIGGVISLVIFFGVFLVLGLFGITIGVSLIALVKLYPALTPMLWITLIFGILAFIIFIWFMSYVITVFTLPIPVFFRFYSIFFIQEIRPQIQLIKPIEKTKDEKPEDTKFNKDMKVF